MKYQNLLKPSLPIASLRMLMGLLFVMHAGARIYNNSVPDFSEFLDSKGFPVSYLLAWLVTLFELVGGALIFFRFIVKLFCIGEVIILIIGIVTVHWEKGWFVADMAIGGAEYSVVLISILMAIYFAERKSGRDISGVL